MAQKLVNVGYDPGRHLAKLYLDDAKVMGMNVICDGFDRRSLEAEEGESLNYMDVEVYKSGVRLGRYFVGGMAQRFNNGDLRWSTRVTPKFSDIEDVPDDILRMVAYIAFSQHEPGSTKMVRIRLGTGSATEDYFENPETLENFRKMLTDTYKVKFMHPLFKGAEVSMIFDEMYFKPEGTATVISSCYDDNLKTVDTVKEIFRQGANIMGINIGSSTSDVAKMLPNMKFDSKGFFGIPVGTNDALNKIRSILKINYGYEVNSFKLAFMLMNYKSIAYKGKPINLEEIKKGPFDNVYATLRNQFYDNCQLRNIDLGETGAIIVAGGGDLELAEKLDKFIPGVPTIHSADPLFQDARGYWLECKFAEMLKKNEAKKVFEGKNPEEIVEG